MGTASKKSNAIVLSRQLNKIIMSKTVIFDLGGVYFSNGTQIAIGSIASKYKIKREPVANILNGDAGGGGGEYRTGMITAKEFWDQVRQHLNIDGSSEELSALWYRSYQPDDKTVKLIDRLRNADHQILYFSNNTAERVAYLDQQYNFLSNFDDGIFSHVVKCKKPDPAIYHLLLEKALNPAAACVYIDDKPDYLEPAKRLGMEVIAFKNAVQLEADLKELGLLD